MDKLYEKGNNLISFRLVSVWKFVAILKKYIIKAKLILISLQHKITLNLFILSKSNEVNMIITQSNMLIINIL